MILSISRLRIACFLLGLFSLLSSVLCLSVDDSLPESSIPKSTIPSNSDTNFTGAFISSFMMIIVSEIGDKTFFIAAIMAMRQSRMEVFIAAMSALALMTVLSAAVGHVLPNVLPPRLTQAAATVLFAFFGVKLLRDAYGMDPNEGASDEMAEVEEELEKKDLEENASLLEGGGSAPSFLSAHSIRAVSKRVWFYFQWGDRSQIATFALAAAKDPYGVTLGGFSGHFCCTGLAVVGGKLLASKISERTIAFMGGFLFLGFAVHSVMFPEM